MTTHNARIAAPSGRPTAPVIHRTPMLSAPWFGFMRGLLFAVFAGPQLRQVARAGHAAGSGNAPAWRAVAQQRRRVLVAVVGVLAGAALWLQLDAAPAHPSTAWWVGTVLSTLLFAWVGVGFTTALMGARVLAGSDPYSLALKDPHAPIDGKARTALIMPICNENIATVFGGLQATCESLAATGALKLFDVYILSDSSDPALRAAELQAWERLRSTLGDQDGAAGDGDKGRVFYRWRRRRTRRKSGNVADFCRRWGANYRYMIVLDADSTMRGDTLVSMVRLMEQNPRAGIIQTLPQAVGHNTLHARLQQFSSRVTGRLFAAGIAYWQLGESHYWGHNAILRVEPFMRHCALASLPGRGGLSGEILSHDFVEAALMGRAGHEVWLAPQLDGSWEQNPPDLLDELQRDRRWCQGNLQNSRLIAEPGWLPAHRVMFLTGALSYLAAPVWLAFMVAGLVSGRGEAGIGGGVGGMGNLGSGGSALWLLTLVMLVLPRLLGVLAVRLRGEQAQFGGSWRLAGNATLELMLSAVQAPVRMLAHSAFVLSALTGLRLEWKSPSRDALAVSWRSAFSRIGLLSFAALGAVLLALSAHHAASPGVPTTLPQWLPLLLPLALAVPFTVYSGSPVVGALLDRLNVMWMAEERRPPRTLARAAARHGFLALTPLPLATAAVASPASAQRWRSTSAGRGFAMALASTAFVVLAMLPRAGVAPELSTAMQAERDLIDMMNAAPQMASMTPASVQVSARKPVARPRIANFPPARMIDDEVRRRATEAVEQAIAMEGSPRVMIAA